MKSRFDLTIESGHIFEHDTTVATCLNLQSDRMIFLCRGDTRFGVSSYKLFVKRFPDCQTAFSGGLVTGRWVCRLFCINGLAVICVFVGVSSFSIFVGSISRYTGLCHRQWVFMPSCPRCQ